MANSKGYTREQKAAILREYDAAPNSGGQRKAIADAHGVSQALLWHWRRARGEKDATTPHAKRYDLTPAQRDKIAQEYADAPASGGHRQRIAEAYGVPVGLPYQWAKTRGLMENAAKRAPAGSRPARVPKPNPTRARKIPFATITAALAESDAGESTDEAIAAKYGFHASRIWYWKKDRAAGVKEWATPPAPSTHGGARPGAGRPPKPTVDLVAVTNRAVQAMNGSAHHSKPGTFIREALLRLRSAGVEVENISVQGNTCTITYTTKEVFEL